MHYPLIISSVGDDEEEAQGLAESALDGYGNGAVFDYYAIGGRFGPTAANDFNDGLIAGFAGNSLRYSDNPELFDATINIQIAVRNSDILEALHCARSGVVMAEPLRRSPLSAADEKRCADIVTEDNAKGGAYWDRLMSITTCAEILEFTEQHKLTQGGVVIYRMEKALQHIEGELLSSSGYFDAEDYTTKRAAVDHRKGENPRNQWITIFDLHN
jgi:hypothetical protein